MEVVVINNFLFLGRLTVVFQTNPTDLTFEEFRPSIVGDERPFCLLKVTTGLRHRVSFSGSTHPQLSLKIPEGDPIMDSRDPFIKTKNL